MIIKYVLLDDRIMKTEGRGAIHTVYGETKQHGVLKWSSEEALCLLQLFYEWNHWERAT